MNKQLLMISASIAASVALIAPAQAALVNDASTFVVVEDFESFDGLVTQGPLTLGGGAQVTSSIDSTIGAFAVDLGDNGNWGAGNHFAGIGDLSFIPGSFDYEGSMSFTWSTGITGAGASFSIYQDVGGTAPILLEALSASGAVLESTSVVINFADSSLYNAASFYGITRSSADIFGLRVIGDGFVVDNLSVAAVPIPAALPLLLSGFAMLGACLRRRRSIQQA